MAMRLNDVAVLNIHEVDYRGIITEIFESESRLRNTNLSKKSGIS